MKIYILKQNSFERSFICITYILKFKHTDPNTKIIKLLYLVFLQTNIQFANFL